MNMRTCISILLIPVLAGCDPGWNYHLAPVPIGKYSTDKAGVQVTALARLFTADLTTTVRIRNITDNEIVLDSIAVSILDARDSELAPGLTRSCTQPEQDRRLPAAGTCQMEIVSSVHPVGFLGRRNSHLRRLSVKVVMQVNGTAVLNVVPLEWDK
jgi:hypothetical protein